MIVTWTTFDSIGKPVVEYGTKKLDLLSTGSSSKFVDGGSERRSMLIHRVLLTNLVPGQTYSKMIILENCLF